MQLELYYNYNNLEVCCSHNIGNINNGVFPPSPTLPTLWTAKLLEFKTERIPVHGKSTSKRVKGGIQNPGVGQGFFWVIFTEFCVVKRERGYFVKYQQKDKGGWQYCLKKKKTVRYLWGQFFYRTKLVISAKQTKNHHQTVPYAGLCKGFKVQFLLYFLGYRNLAENLRPKMHRKKHLTKNMNFIIFHWTDKLLRLLFTLSEEMVLFQQLLLKCHE